MRFLPVTAILQRVNLEDSAAFCVFSMCVDRLTRELVRCATEIRGAIKTIVAVPLRYAQPADMPVLLPAGRSTGTDAVGLDLLTENCWHA